jgi:hypothetical protein
MAKDPIVEEVRAIRDAYAKQFDYDIGAIYRAIKDMETDAGRKLTSRPAKSIEPILQKTA